MGESRIASPANTVGLQIPFLIWFAKLLVFFTLNLLAVFLYKGSSFGVLDLGFSEAGILCFNTMLCCIFFIQHSTMIRKSFQQWLSRFIKTPYHGILFAITSAISLLLLLSFWQQASTIILELDKPFAQLTRLCYFASVLGLGWCTRSLHSFDIVGKGALLVSVSNKTLPVLPFIVQGPYRFVRHPFYSFMLLMMWSTPNMTTDRFLFNCLWTGWVIMGTIFEERDLKEHFGQDYEAYQRTTPMLIPWKKTW